MGKNWLIVSQPGEARTLADMFACPPEELSALVIGARELAVDTAKGVSEVVWIDPGSTPQDDFANTAAELILQDEAAVVAGVATPAARAISGIVGVKAKMGIVSNVTKIEPGSPIVIEHLKIDNHVIETMQAQGPVVALANPLAVKADAAFEGGTSAPIEQMNAEPAGTVSRTGIEPSVENGLESAERVVGIGRGVQDQDAFTLAKRLADTLGAEMGCSMPVYTDLHYLPDEAHYIGLSGLRINAKLYFMLGISGTSQHLAGIRNVETVVCVNKDPKAKIFSNANYGIVGSIEDIVPALIEALE